MEYISVSEARKKKKNIRYNPVTPKYIETRVIDHCPVKKLTEYIDWTPFLNGWGLKGRFPDILNKENVGREAKRVLSEGKTILNAIIKNEMIRPKGIFGLFPANSKGDDIIVYDQQNHNKVIAKFPMLRQQAHYKNENHSWSLSDYIAPVETGLKDYIGLFAVTSGHEAEYHSERYKKENDVYSSLMFRFIADRITEAFAEKLHESVRKKFWGYQPDENLTNDQLIREEYAGTRPAPGYPACPDHTLKKTIFNTLGVESEIGIQLTPDYVMKPVSSITGFYISHPESKYFRIGKITREQVEDYAKRSQVPYTNAEKRLRAIVNYKPNEITQERQNQDN